MSYSSIIRRASEFLQHKRSHSRLWRSLLPECIFNKGLWLWEPRSVSIGAAWGAFCALAPIPLQSIVAVIGAMHSKANVPIALMLCWISIPGYQLVVWPLQWWLGNLVFTAFGQESGFSLTLAKQSTLRILNGESGLVFQQLGTQFPSIACEFLLGCLISCSAAAAAAYALFALLSLRISPPHHSDS